MNDGGWDHYSGNHQPDIMNDGHIFRGPVLLMSGAMTQDSGRRILWYAIWYRTDTARY